MAFRDKVWLIATYFCPICMGMLEQKSENDPIEVEKAQQKSGTKAAFFAKLGVRIHGEG